MKPIEPIQTVATIRRARRCLFIAIAITLSSFSSADTALNVSQLDQFKADLTDPDTKRHYTLASKQSAIHHWHIRDCMRDKGFADNTATDNPAWQNALYGKYAYCEDHHIPGIDPPCPSEKVVLESVNNSCFQTSYNKIDWSSNIINKASRDLPEKWSVDATDPVMLNIEKSWSDCMHRNNYDYKNRASMYSSFAPPMADQAIRHTPVKEQDDVKKAAEACFASTLYYQRIKSYTHTLRVKFFSARQAQLESMLKRYQQAEKVANESVRTYCAQDRSAFIKMYQENKLINSTAICDE